MEGLLSTGLPCLVAKLQIYQFSPVQLLIRKSVRHYICLVVYSVDCHTFDNSHVTMALEDAQGIYLRGIWTVSRLSLDCLWTGPIQS